jgi:hypothetical protein
MSELEKIKIEAISSLKKLCAKCKENSMHNCRIGKMITDIASINGVPVIVNDNLYHVVFN